MESLRRKDCRYLSEGAVISLTLKPFLHRYATFTLAKVGLVLGRWLILMLALRWLVPSEFGRIAGVLSIIEILRALGDIGAESIIYARLLAADRPLPRIVKKLVRLRVFVSSLLGFFAAILFALFTWHEAWLMFALIPVSAFQNASVAFLQKSRNLMQIFILAVTAIFVATASAAVAWIVKAEGIELCLLLLLPEAIAAIVGMIFTRKYWFLVMHAGKFNTYKFFYRLLPFVGPSAAVALLVMGYTRLDVLLVLPLLGLLAQADYSAGFRLVEPAFLVLSLASVSLLAELGTLNTRHARLAAERIINWLNFPVFAGFFGVACLLGLSVDALAGNLFRLSTQASQVAGVLALAIPIKLLNTFLTTLLQRGGRYDSVLRAAMLNAVVTWSIALAMGSVLGIIGVALGALVGEVMNFWFQRRSVNIMLKRGNDAA